MATYQVDFTYLVPEWGNVELDADTQETAKELAMSEIEDLYPEAVEIEITNVSEI